MSLPASKDPGIIPLRLPDLPHEGQPGARFISRSVSFTMLTLAALFVAALVVSVTVRMDVTVKAGGVLEPIRLYPIRAMQNGPVREVFVETGDTVQRGALLARLDTVEVASSIAQLEAQLRAADVDRRRSASADPLQLRQSAERASQARARLSSALAMVRQRMIEYDLGTNVDSLLANHVPGRHVTLDQAVGDVRSAQADIRLSAGEGDLQSLSRFDREKLGTQMDQLTAQINALRARKEQLTIVAPTDGVVLTDELERLPGTFVREGDQVFELADLRDWRVQLTVSERDVYRIQVGDSVKVELVAFDQSEREQLGGRVVYVSPDPLTVQAPSGGTTGPVTSVPTGNYRVIATLDRAQLEKVGITKFRRGYTVQGNVITKSGRIITLLWNYMMEKLQKNDSAERLNR
ncbi:MAG TPA: efflux RND transporter periplasmic adaptor subunit [Longimicrobium sp.]|nr:efflux RND transporter periplasmic adaptor subunit [Longimicrobium sp.]